MEFEQMQGIKLKELINQIEEIRGQLIFFFRQKTKSSSFQNHT